MALQPSLSVRVGGTGSGPERTPGGDGSGRGEGLGGSGGDSGGDPSTPKDQDSDPFAGLDTPTVGGPGGAAKKLCMICMDRDRGVLSENDLCTLNARS